jgi:RsiW-degrading membrane proteinase PrsW (M82 family)
MGWVYLSAAFAPALFLLHFIYVRDKYEREPLHRILLVYFVSFLAVIPASIWEVTSPNWEQHGLAGIALATWGVIALAEETCKYLFLRWLVVRHPSFNEVYDGILYGVSASLGFATAENIMYVFSSGADGLTVAVLRAVLSVPAHALWGVMMGYYIGRDKFAPPPARLMLTTTGVLLAIFWHGLYDFLAFGADVEGNAYQLEFMGGVFGVVAINWVIGLLLIRRAQAESVFKRPPPLVNPIAAVGLRRVRYCHKCGRVNAVSTAFCHRCGAALG